MGREIGIQGGRTRVKVVKKREGAKRRREERAVTVDLFVQTLRF